jgi:hypothetical protein
MSTPETTTCALCAKPALQVAAPNHGRYAAIRCTSCGDFVMAGAAAGRIAGLPGEFKDACRAEIRAAKPDQIFLLTPIGAGSNLKAELVARTSLSL